MIYSCCQENRRILVLDSSLNGIDFLEVMDNDAAALDSDRQRTLLIHCLKPAPTDLTPQNVVITGGDSITNIVAEWVAPATIWSTPGFIAPPPVTPKEKNYFASLVDRANVLVVRTNKVGDFSRYDLCLNDDEFDSQLNEIGFSFKVECPSNFDCAPQSPSCPSPAPVPPPINYLAKDYGSFRSIILDRLNQLTPTWGGTSEADLGVVLAELIAYAGDYLSYQQDAVATEAYLETARSRVSLRRHAMLVDYHVHDGCNARVWVHVKAKTAPGTPVLLPRSLTRFYTRAPGMPSSLAVGSGNEEAALLSGVQVFEPMFDAVLYPDHNCMSFYTWGDVDCCLPAGSTMATLDGSFPNLKQGDVLIFQEIMGPKTGLSADADFRHRCAVRLQMDAIVRQDPVNACSGKPKQVTEIHWFQDDALPFPLCISSSYLDDKNDIKTLIGVSVALGNVVLADHGLTFSNKYLATVPAPGLQFPPSPGPDRCNPTLPTPVSVRFRPLLPDSPVTQAVPLAGSPLRPRSVDNPMTDGVLSLGAGSVGIKNSQDSICLTLKTTNTANWPSLFGVIATRNPSNPANFDLSIVYAPPGGAAGIQGRTTVEEIKNLSLDAGDVNFALTRINAESNLIRVPSNGAPAVESIGDFRVRPTMLPVADPVNLQDKSGRTILILQAFNPTAWSAMIGVAAQPGSESDHFDLSVVFQPQTGHSARRCSGDPSHIVLEKFIGLALSDAFKQINDGSALVASFETADLTLSAKSLMHFNAADAVPIISLDGTVNGSTHAWSPKLDLLESGELDRDFVVEVESNGAANIRFGDNTNGRVPEIGTWFSSRYRIGNGALGNVGAESLINVTPIEGISSCCNPLPATGGVDSETNEQIRRRAPQAMLSQERAVTMADYEKTAQANPQVKQAVASLRWTGSWYTAFVAVEPKGGGNLSTDLQRTLQLDIDRYRYAGEDLQLDSPEYVSLEIELTVCVDPNYFRGNVQRALLQVLGTKTLPDGRKGVFYPDNFTFGQTVYLSPVYAAARSVAGVVSVTATKFQRLGVDTSQYLLAGEIKLGSLEVARLENDPNHPDHGKLTLTMQGGK